jgi:hypothetical protein
MNPVARITPLPKNLFPVSTDSFSPLDDSLGEFKDEWRNHSTESGHALRNDGEQGSYETRRKDHKDRADAESKTIRRAGSTVHRASKCRVE